MKKAREFGVLLREILEQQELLACTLSKLRKKDTVFQKVSVRPVELKGKRHYQVTYHYAQKELHDNLQAKQAEKVILDLMKRTFRQGYFFTPRADWQVLVSKKGTIKVLKHPPSRSAEQGVSQHDRGKQYILKEGIPYRFLVELGVMNQSGKVLAKRYRKFRQLNKYLEIVEDCLPYLEGSRGEKRLTIVDFGSGKAYLTFALYYYLVKHLDLDVEIIGLDLKQDVVSFCNKMAKTLGYERLTFFHQDIRDFRAEGMVDMVVALHACDVATDYALAQAVKWKSQVILAVPCCQHEVFQQLDDHKQSVLLEHGIVKERMAALITDAARAKLLETQDYQVKVMEFIDLEHTPKNLLIRAFRQLDPSTNQASEDYERFKNFWSVTPTLEVLLAQKGSSSS